MVKILILIHLYAKVPDAFRAFFVIFTIKYLILFSGEIMPCPFMSRLPSTFVRNYGGNILKTYAEHCPIASQAVSIYMLLCRLECYHIKD